MNNMPELTPTQREFIESTWKNRWESILQAQNQVVNWLFAVHGGGIAGLLAYAASKSAAFSVKVGLGAFTGGLVLIVFYGVFMFYFESHHFYRFRNDVKELYAGSIDWSEFSRRLDGTPDESRTCEVLAWASGILGLVGLAAAAVAIL